jgi:hypothetical protein
MGNCAITALDKSKPVINIKHPFRATRRTKAADSMAIPSSENNLDPNFSYNG